MFVLLVASVLLQNLYVWQNNINGFARKYDSYIDILFSREKGTFLISIVAGLIPAGIGIILRWIDSHA